MNIVSIVLIKVLMKKEVSAEFIKEFNKYHNTSVSAKELLEIWNREVVRLNKPLHHWGIAPLGISFDWDNTRLGFGYWSDVNFKFIAYDKFLTDKDLENSSDDDMIEIL